MLKKTILFALTSTLALNVWAGDEQSKFSYQPYILQAKALVKQMTDEEKVGQMMMPTLELLFSEKSKNALDACKFAWTSEKNLIKLGKKCGLDAIRKYHLGAILSAADPLPYSGEDQARSNWKKTADIAQSFYTGPKGTSLLLGTDAIHGDQHIPGAVLFPQNIGLGVTHNPDLIKQIAYWTARDILTSGFNWSFTPTVAVAHDYRWGRTYESFSADPVLVRALAYAYVRGLQNPKNNKITGVLGTAKHFMGDGATKNGEDEGYAYEKDLAKFWQENGLGYEGAVEAHVGSIMASYSSLNNIPMHFGGDGNLLNQFKSKGIMGSEQQTYRLDGFVVSDYVGAARAAYKYNLQHKDKLDYVHAVAKTVNAGVDMLMLGNGAYMDPFDYDLSSPPYKMRSKIFYENLKDVQNALLVALKQNLISVARLDDAVTRIIAVKLAINDAKITQLNPQQKHQQATVALQAAEQSLVLLKNEKNGLPLKKESIKHVFLLGEYDDIGIQNGGWTIHWQGQKGNKFWPAHSDIKKSAAASSLKDGITTVLGKQLNYYYGEAAVVADNLMDARAENTLAIIAIAELPYAEYMGDVDNDNPWYKRGALGKENIYMPKEQSKFLGIHFSEAQLTAIAELKKKGIHVVTVLFSGRPLVITDGAEKSPLSNSDVFIAAFLPGTSGGQAIANAIFGDYRFKSQRSEIVGKTYFSNTLSFAWPASMQEVRDHRYSLFSVGYGLGT